MGWAVKLAAPRGIGIGTVHVVSHATIRLAGNAKLMTGDRTSTRARQLSANRNACGTRITCELSEDAPASVALCVTHHNEAPRTGKEHAWWRRATTLSHSRPRKHCGSEVLVAKITPPTMSITSETDGEEDVSESAVDVGDEAACTIWLERANSLSCAIKWCGAGPRRGFQWAVRPTGRAFRGRHSRQPMPESDHARGA